jgi:hypothetical protein
MDLSKLSDKDLEAIAAGRMEDVSTAALQVMAGESPKPQRSRAEELLRQLGLTARAGIEGAASLPSMVANVPYALTDVGIGLAQKMGANVPTLQQRGISATRSGQIIADILGLPKPETQMEQGVQSIAQAMGGAGSAARMAEALANRAVAPSVRAMTQQGTQVAQKTAPALITQEKLQPTATQQTLQMLAQSPLAQVLAGGTAASATEAVKEMGGGTGAQLAAGLFGGAMIPGSAGGAQTVSRAAREIVRPGTEAGREVIAGNVLRSLASDAERAIMAAEGYQAPIAGYRPTTAQATRDIGLASAETPIRGLDQTGKFAQQQVEANRARMAILDRLAKDKDALERAMSKRDEVTSPLREEAFLKAQNVSPETFQSATALTVNKTIDDILKSDVGARGTVIKTMNWAKEQLSRGTTPARMYEVRKDLRDAAQGLLDKEGAAYSLAKRELEQVIRSVDDAIDAAAPGYKDYLDKYAKSSRGIERMEAAQQFRGKVMSTIPDPSNIGEYLISQPSFTRAIRAAAEDTKLSKTQLAVLQRVSQDIDSGVLARATKVPGSDTFKNLSTANIIGGIVGKQMFGEVPPAFAKVVAPMNWLYNGSDDAIRQLLVDAMLDPQLAAKMMRRATQATVEPLSEELKKKALAGGLGTAFGLE